MRARSILAGGAAVLGCSALLGCNSILGIDAASAEPVDASVSADGANAADVSHSEGPPTLDYTETCGDYCALMAKACGPTGTIDNTEYLSVDVCNALCPIYWQHSELPLIPAVEPVPSDDLGCRVWHANAAIVDNDPHTHCPHAGPLGGGRCDMFGNTPQADFCTPFCKLNLAICTGDNAAYASMPDCMSACQADAGYPGYPYLRSPNDASVVDLAPGGNTLNCRMYHLENAIFTGSVIGPPTHCPHTGVAGGNAAVGFVCTDPDN